MLIFGALDAAVPVIWKRERMWSSRLIEWHFWLAVAGTVGWVFAMWNSGILQGLMWRTYTEAGTLQYSFIETVTAMRPYYIARAMGGTAFIIGTILCCWNVWMTIRVAPDAEPVHDYPTSPAPGAAERGVPAE